MQGDMFQAGAMLRRPPGALALQQERALAQHMERLNLRDRTQAEQYEDVGQGEYLCGQKRLSAGVTTGAPSVQPQLSGGSGLPSVGRPPPPQNNMHLGRSL